MTQEEKQLLLKDLCARLFYGVKVATTVPAVKFGVVSGISTKGKITVEAKNAHIVFECTQVKPYLRPMSSMTKEEFEDLLITTELQYDQLELVDWWNGCKTLEFYLSEIPQFMFSVWETSAFQKFSPLV